MELIKISTQETITFKQLRETYYNVAFPKDLKNADLSEYDAAVVATDLCQNTTRARKSLNCQSLR